MLKMLSQPLCCSQMVTTDMCTIVQVAVLSDATILCGATVERLDHGSIGVTWQGHSLYVAAGDYESVSIDSLEVYAIRKFS